MGVSQGGETELRCRPQGGLGGGRDLNGGGLQ